MRALNDGRIGSIRVSLILLAVSCSLTACAGGGSSESDTDPSDEPIVAAPIETEPVAPNGSDVLRVSTFNTGLLPYFVPRTDERVAPVARAVAAHDADVICLQEVWRAEDQQIVANALHTNYPYVSIPPAHQKFASAVPVCQADDLGPVADCALTRCLSASGGFVECLMGICQSSLSLLAAQNPECAQAITAQAGSSILDLIEVQTELLGSSGAAGLFAFNGTSGLILASKLPLEQVQVVDFFDITTTTRRAAILATVSKNGVSHRVGCTHLQSNLDGLLPYTGRNGSWVGEQAVQAQRLLSAAAAYSGSDPQYLAGDFNCSRANSLTGVSEDVGETCDRFLNAGYSDPAAEQLRCTFCSDNLENASKDDFSETRNTVLDHVFLRSQTYSGATSERVFNETVSIGDAPANLSDHFGVRLTAPVP